MVLKSLWGKPKKRTDTPKSDSLNFSVTESENSYKMEMLEVTNENGPVVENPMKPEMAESAAAEQGAEYEYTAPSAAAAEASLADYEGEPFVGGEATFDIDEEFERTPAEPAGEPIESMDEIEAIADSVSEESHQAPREIPRVRPIIIHKEVATPAPRIRRSRATTVATTPQSTDTYESQERKEKEEAMVRMWRRATTPKKVPFPSRFPGYLKEPPELSYEETNASIRRRNYNENRIKEYRETPFKRDESKVKHMSPKTNRALQLRTTFIRREPLISKYFSDHYNLHKKPPFKHTNVKYCIGR